MRRRGGRLPSATFKRIVPLSDKLAPYAAVGGKPVRWRPVAGGGGGGGTRVRQHPSAEPDPFADVRCALGIRTPLIPEQHGEHAAVRNGHAGRSPVRPAREATLTREES